jgi:DNA-binding MarR family transcriptional regulator
MPGTSRSREAGPNDDVTVVSVVNYRAGMPPALPVADLAGLASHLRLSVFRASRTLRRESQAGISPTMLAALSTIDRHGPITAGDLAAHEQVRKPTVTRILGALLEEGLIERTPDPLDRRVAWVQLTPEGRSLMRNIRRRSDRFLAARLERLDPVDLTTLQRAAEILDHVMEHRS